jgi:hypothetical protein
MGCGCGKKTEQALAKSFEYVAPNGSKTLYRSEIEARAAVIKNGGGAYRPIAR